jgi:hypothetical protein
VSHVVILDSLLAVLARQQHRTFWKTWIFAHFLAILCIFMKEKTLHLPLNAETISLFFREEQSPSPVQLLVWSKASHSAPPLAAGWIT